MNRLQIWIEKAFFAPFEKFERFDEIDVLVGGILSLAVTTMFFIVIAAVITNWVINLSSVHYYRYKGRKYCYYRSKDNK